MKIVITKTSAERLADALLALIAKHGETTKVIDAIWREEK